MPKRVSSDPGPIDCGVIHAIGGIDPIREKRSPLEQIPPDSPQGRAVEGAGEKPGEPAVVGRKADPPGQTAQAGCRAVIPKDRSSILHFRSIVERQPPGVWEVHHLSLEATGRTGETSWNCSASDENAGLRIELTH